MSHLPSMHRTGRSQTPEIGADGKKTRSSLPGFWTHADLAVSVDWPGREGIQARFPNDVGALTDEILQTDIRYGRSNGTWITCETPDLMYYLSLLVSETSMHNTDKSELTVNFIFASHKTWSRLPYRPRDIHCLPTECRRRANTRKGFPQT